MPTIEGTATYHHVQVSPRPEENSVEVAGSYHDDRTTYLAEDVFVEGLRIEPEGAGTIVITGDKWVWVEARETEIRISAEEPGDE